MTIEEIESLKDICRKAGGLLVLVSFDGLCDYSKYPPIWRPHSGARFSGAIVFDDVHNMQEKECFKTGFERGLQEK